MALYGAFSSSMLGMMSQSYALNNIGANIANVNTGGYKRTDTHFSTVLSDTINTTSDIGGVKPQDSQRIDLQGTIVSTSRNLDAAISGHGFFVLNTQRDGNGETYYTRDGSFQTVTGDPITVTADDGISTITSYESYLVDKNGHYVMGWAPNADGTFTTTAGTMQALRVDAYAFQASGVTTTANQLDLNLPATDDPGGQHSYNIYVYDTNGTNRTIEMQFEKQTALNTWTATPVWKDTPVAQVDTVTLGGTPEAGDTYQVTVNGTTVSYTATGAEADIGAVRDNLLALLSANGVVTASATPAASGANAITLSAVTAGTGFTASATATNGGATADNTASSATTTANSDGTTTGTATTITFDSDAQVLAPTSIALDITWGDGGTVSTALDISNITQYAGDFTPHNYWQNGYGSGQLREFSFDQDGNIQGAFSNTQVRPIYRIGLAVFSNPNALDMRNGNLFKESTDSGSATIVTAGSNTYGSISGNALEISNVDIADEFTNMIVTQQAYNSSATVFRTVDEMTVTARDLKK